MIQWARILLLLLPLLRPARVPARPGPGPLGLNCDEGGRADDDTLDYQFVEFIEFHFVVLIDANAMA